MNNYRPNNDGNRQYNNFANYKNDEIKKRADTILEGFKKEWIINEPDKECVEFCDKLAHIFAEGRLSSSFIRNIYGELTRIQVGGFDSHKPDFYLLRPKVAYAVTRSDKKEIAEYYRELYNKMADCVENATHFYNLVKIAEAVIAYHKTYYDK